ncbi:hypothetical protein [Silvimonas amylolytica]|uniref:TubC N-terminal docking domain-containing protein n=1 Tax=Silvimonas amylolytica TaxID=449663 RepID=A0ABQ2PII4_9NEIS|nr:hypothetical protein [Silvimonas amylolytica]GGP24832.1 hypothetical protein GCM10010971_06510 [Silvimonas amylolytica]
MNAAQLIDYASSHGLILSVWNGNIRMTGNRQAANDKLINDLRQHKSEVIDLLTYSAPSVMVPFALLKGGGGQMFDRQGIVSAITKLIEHYGSRLDLLALLLWLEQRKTTVWPASRPLDLKQDVLALDVALQAIAKAQIKMR